MTGLDLLGYIASLASGGAFLPQAIRAIRTRSTRDISLTSAALGFAGMVLWASYGWLIGSLPIMISNVVVAPFALATLVMKVRHG